MSEFGSRRLSTLTGDELQRFLDSKSSLSFRTVYHLRWDLKQILEMAVAEDALSDGLIELAGTLQQSEVLSRLAAELSSKKRIVTN